MLGAKHTGWATLTRMNANPAVRLFQGCPMKWCSSMRTVILASAILLAARVARAEFFTLPFADQAAVLNEELAQTAKITNLTRNPRLLRFVFPRPGSTYIDARARRATCPVSTPTN
jgi:hypothetical protein